MFEQLNKIKLLVISILLLSIQLMAQVYPEVTIKDIQFQSSDQLINPPHDNPSPLNGDTVTVVGVVMNSPYFHANPDSGLILHAGAPAIFLQDQDHPEWGAIEVRDPNGSSAFAALDTGMVVRCTGEVSEFFTTTQMNLIDFQPQDVISFSTRPTPVLLTLDSLVVTGTSTPNYLAEKWEGVYVEIQNVIATDLVSLGSGSYGIVDNNNNLVYTGNISDYYRNRISPPLPGTTIQTIRGIIETRTNLDNGWFILSPIYPNDIAFGSIVPPNISNVTRDNGTVGFGQGVQISANILDADGIIDIANLHYSINGGTYQVDEMILTAGNTYVGSIPAQSDSSIVTYYIEAIDNDAAVSTNPTDIIKNVYFYYVLNRALSIQDVQRSPFGGGWSGYNNYEVTVSGVVTADSSTVTANGGEVFIQNGNGPWSGIQIFGTEVLKLKVGDDVTVTGFVNEFHSFTRIEGLDSPTSVVVNGTSAVPEPSDVSTSDIGGLGNGDLSAEPWESVLIRYSNVTVVDENADGNPGNDEGSGGNRNFGEMTIADNGGVATRVELQDGRNDYNNDWNASLDDSPFRIFTWNTFSSLSGILSYSFGNYKLIPRTNDDFVGWVTDVKTNEITPENFTLKQNYPNPFNPSTTIEFTLPQSNFVSLKIYTILGEEVAQLINSEIGAGTHQVQFDASNLTSGIYFYRISAGQFVSVKKMILLK